MKILFYYPPTFPKILKALVKTFPTKLSLLNAQEKRKKKGGEKAKFCFLCMPELLKLIFSIWLRSPQRA